MIILLQKNGEREHKGFITLDPEEMLAHIINIYVIDLLLYE